MTHKEATSRPAVSERLVPTDYDGHVDRVGALSSLYFAHATIFAHPAHDRSLCANPIRRWIFVFRFSSYTHHYRDPKPPTTCNVESLPFFSGYQCREGRPAYSRHWQPLIRDQDWCDPDPGAGRESTRPCRPFPHRCLRQPTSGHPHSRGPQGQIQFEVRMDLCQAPVIGICHVGASLQLRWNRKRARSM